MAMDFQGSTITAYFDGTVLDSICDSSYSAGQVGFGVVGYQTDQFDNLAVTAQP